jgi:hypothetical protein
MDEKYKVWIVGKNAVEVGYFSLDQYTFRFGGTINIGVGKIKSFRVSLTLATKVLAIRN